MSFCFVFLIKEVLQKRYRKMEDSRQETNESSSTESDTHQESGENMDFEDSQDSVWTTQSTSNTTFDSHKHNPDLESVDSGKILSLLLNLIEPYITVPIIVHLISFSYSIN
jgi:hypothetical protein